MRTIIKRAADIFFTVVLGASLSGCASILDYWNVDANGNPPPSAGEEQAAQMEAETDGGSGAAEETVGEAPVSENNGAEAVPLSVTENPQIRESRDSAEEARQAQKKAEEELANANRRIAELEAEAAARKQAEEAAVVRNQAAGEEVARNTPAGDAAAPPAAAEELAAARKQAADAEAARKKAEADAEAARKKAASDLAAAQKKAADAEAARKKAEADAEAARKKAASDLAAAQKKAADAEAARKKAEADAAAAQKKAASDLAAARKQAADAEAAQKKAEADAAAALLQSSAREKTSEEELSRTVGTPPGYINVSLTNTPAIAEAVAATAVQAPAFVPAPAPGEAVEYYTVGAWPPDCFWEIAEFVYGDPFRWPVIYEANRDKLEDPDNPNLLKSGVILRIPPLPDAQRGTP